MNILHESVVLSAKTPHRVKDGLYLWGERGWRRMLGFLDDLDARRN